MSELPAVIAALKADGDELEKLVTDLDEADWRRSTPAPGWTVAHQIAHLTATFQLAGLAASDAAKFKAVAAQASTDFSAAVDAALQPFLALPPHELLPRWRQSLDGTAAALSAVPADEVVPWLVNPLPPTVLTSAGMMELFAHGQDIADALGVTIERTDRIGYITAFAVRTRDFGYLARGLTPPQQEFRFELTAPSGALWPFGPEDASQRITGPALDFCLLASRRRHHVDLSLTADGDQARHWLEIAQAYRGPAGEGRRPGQFAPAHR
jgi:uncharacterized protein (TIGR03084 family)